MSFPAEQSALETHPEISPVVRETDPVVIMDIDMGKVIPAGQILEVDYPALRNTLRVIGAPEDNSDLIVAVAAHRRFESLRGYYAGDTDEYREDGASGPLVVVGSNPSIKRFGSAFTQTVLQHELSHYIDDLKDMPNDPNSALFGAATAVTSRVTGVAAFSVADGAIRVGSDYFSPIPPGMSVETADRLYGLLDQATTVGAVAAVGLVALAGAYYQRAPGEVRARKSQRINLSPFVVIEDADQHS